jgi:DNA-directed RNA polymerase specialized sigma subunit
MSTGTKRSDDSFQIWINEVRNAPRQIEELKQQLEFLNMKLIGCNAVTYDRVPTSTISFKDTKFTWLCKIEEVEDKIRGLTRKMEECKEFQERLTSREQQVFELYFIKLFRGSEISRYLGISRSRILELYNKIILKSGLF